jgi:hypothetical protein
LPVTPIAAKMESVLNVALPLPAPADPAIAPPAPRPAAHHRRAAAARLAPPAAEEAAPLPQVETPPPALSQPAVIETVIKIVLPTLPVIEPQPTATPADDTLCRRPQTLPGTRLPGPTICKPKSEWAALRAKKLDVWPDGIIYSSVEYQKNRSLAARFCGSTGPGASTANSWVPRSECL